MPSTKSVTLNVRSKPAVADVAYTRFASAVRFLSFGILLAFSTLNAQSTAVSGTIVSIDADTGIIILRPDLQTEHLEFVVGRGDRLILREGQSIRGEAVPYGGAKRLQTIWPNDLEQARQMAHINADLIASSRERRGRIFRGVGERVPSFALFDQHGRVFTHEQLIGKYTILNFIFTRCAVPTMCPLSTRKMLETQQLLANAGLSGVQLVSMTLDPLFDTPGVFKAYALDYELNENNFFLLGGPSDVLELLKNQMGVLAEDDPVQIIRHTMSTALIGPDGRIVHRMPGNNWTPDSFVERILRAKESGR